MPATTPGLQLPYGFFFLTVVVVFGPDLGGVVFDVTTTVVVGDPPDGGATVVVTAGSVVVGATTTVVVVGAGAAVVVVTTGRSSRLFEGGMMAGLLGALVTDPRVATIQHREPAAGVTDSVVRRLFLSTVVTADLSKLMEVSTGAFTPPERRVQSTR